MGHQHCPECGHSVATMASSCRACGSQLNHTINPILFFVGGLLASIMAVSLCQWSLIAGLIAFGLVFYALHLVTKDRRSVRRDRRKY